MQATNTNYENLLLPQYSIQRLNDQVILIKIKNDQDQPYRIRFNTKGEQILEQYWQHNKFSAGRWFVRSKHPDTNQLFLTIIKRHNKAVPYMNCKGIGWQKIILK